MVHAEGKDLREVLKAKGRHFSAKNSLSGADIRKFWLP